MLEIQCSPWSGSFMSDTRDGKRVSVGGADMVGVMQAGHCERVLASVWDQ